MTNKKIIKMSIEEKEFLNKLIKAKELAPSISEFVTGKFKGEEIENLVRTFKDRFQKVEIQKGFVVVLCKEVLDRMIRNYKKSFTDFDSFGMPSNLFNKEMCYDSNRFSQGPLNRPVKYRLETKRNIK